MSTTSTEISVSSGFGVRRVSKAGKETYRSALGVITSGNTSEKTQLAGTVIEGLWANATYRPIVRELTRVYAPLFKQNKQFGMSFAEACGLNDYAPNKKGLLAFFEAVVRADTEKPTKGEKSIYVAAMRRVIDHEIQLAIELQAEADAAQGHKDAATA